MDKTLKIAILLTAVDHMSEKVTQAVEKSHRKLKAIEGINSAGSLAITGGVAAGEFFLERIEQAEQYEKAQKRIEATFKHQFKDYEHATELARQYAEQSSMQIGVEEENIAAVQAKLSIFKRVANAANLTNGVFNRATQAAFDMQAAGLGDATQNVIRLGKVLDNPLKSLNSLSRAGIVFNNQEKAKITQLLKSNKLFDAQDLILKKIEGRMGGTAKATATSGERMHVAWHKIGITIGNAVLPLFEKFTHWLLNVMPKITRFIKEHQTLIKYIAIGSAVLLGLGIALKIVAAAMTLVEVASGPVGLIIIGIAALAFVLIKYWKPISGFFVRLWDGIKNVFSKAWQFIKFIFLNTTPAGLIIKYWKPLTNFFKGLWSGIKMVFSNAWQGIKTILIQYNPIVWIYNHWNQLISWFSNLGTVFYNAGKNIVKSIGNGIKSMIMWPINQVKGMVQKIRNFLPFSPAKEGPLRDIHKIKLVETIAASINSKPLIKAMSGALGDMAGYKPKLQPIASVVGGGGITVNLHYAPTINGNASGLDLRKHAKEITAMVEEEIRKRQRTRF